MNRGLGDTLLAGTSKKELPWGNRCPFQKLGQDVKAAWTGSFQGNQWLNKQPYHYLIKNSGCFKQGILGLGRNLDKARQDK